MAFILIIIILFMHLHFALQHPTTTTAFMRLLPNVNAVLILLLAQLVKKEPTSTIINSVTYAETHLCHTCSEAHLHKATHNKIKSALLFSSIIVNVKPPMHSVRSQYVGYGMSPRKQEYITCVVISCLNKLIIPKQYTGNNETPQKSFVMNLFLTFATTQKRAADQFT